MSKTFYVAYAGDNEGTSWPASNFSREELSVINRFLKELGENADFSREIEAIIAFDDEDDITDPDNAESIEERMK